MPDFHPIQCTSCSTFKRKHISSHNTHRPSSILTTTCIDHQTHHPSGARLATASADSSSASPTIGRRSPTTSSSCAALLTRSQGLQHRHTSHMVRCICDILFDFPRGLAGRKITPLCIRSSPVREKVQCHKKHVDGKMQRKDTTIMRYTHSYPKKRTPKVSHWIQSMHRPVPVVSCLDEKFPHLYDTTRRKHTVLSWRLVLVVASCNSTSAPPRRNVSSSGPGCRRHAYSAQSSCR